MTYIIFDVKTNKEIRFEDLPNCPHIGEEIYIKKQIPGQIMDDVIQGKVIRLCHQLYVENYQEPFVTIHIA